MASGIIPDQIITLSDMMATESGATDPYVLLSFPTRVKVTGVSFTVNEAGLGNEGDGLEYKLYCVKGKHSKADEGAWDEDIVNFFPWDEKPTIICDNNTKFRSNIVAPLENETWYTYGPTYEADIAQMDTDEYLTIWVENSAGDDTAIQALAGGWQDVRFTVSIAYEGATNID